MTQGRLTDLRNQVPACKAILPIETGGKTAGAPDRTVGTRTGRSVMLFGTVQGKPVMRQASNGLIHGRFEFVVKRGKLNGQVMDKPLIARRHRVHFSSSPTNLHRELLELKAGSMISVEGTVMNGTADACPGGDDLFVRHVRAQEMHYLKSLGAPAAASARPNPRGEGPVANALFGAFEFVTLALIAS